NCVIRNLTQDAIGFRPGAASSLAVVDTLVADNGRHGIAVQPTGAGIGVVTAAFTRVGAYNNVQRGIGLFGDLISGAWVVRGIAVDSVVGYNGTGFLTVGNNLDDLATGLGSAVLRVFRSAVFSNGQGITAEALSTIYVSQTNLEEANWNVTTSGQVFSY